MLYIQRQKLAYFFAAKGAESIKSPFVAKFYKEVVLAAKHHAFFDEIEAIRNRLVQDPRVIDMEDYGTGGKDRPFYKRAVADIAKRALKPQKLASMLFRVVGYFKPKTVVELGTSLGLTTIYLAKANASTKVVTFDGAQNVAKIARENFDQMHVNPDIIVGNLDETLPTFVKNFNGTLDYIFFDANHAYEPTLRYFEDTYPKANENSVFIFDDIHISKQMNDAWKKIKADPRVTISIDVYEFGICFFKKDEPKQDYILKF